MDVAIGKCLTSVKGYKIARIAKLKAKLNKIKVPRIVSTTKIKAKSPTF